MSLPMNRTTIYYNLSFYKEIINIESDNIKRDSSKRSQWEFKYDKYVSNKINFVTGKIN